VKNMRRTVFSFSLAALVVLIWPATALAATDPGLATAGNFLVLAGSTVTNTGPTTIAGQVGLSPGSAITGFPPGSSGTQHIANAVAGQAQVDLTNAFTNAAAAVNPCPPANDRTGVNLGGQTLVPGVYCQTTAPTLTGTLTLNGSGIYIFQIGSTLVTAAGAPGAPAAIVSLIGGAQPCQVFWRVASSATIDTYTNFVGNIMALTDISLNTGATLNGRALARNGQVSLQSNVITAPSGCSGGVVAPGTGVPSELMGEFPWLLLIGVGGGLGAIALTVSSARRRRRSS
jgi:hypothetical protein